MSTISRVGKYCAEIAELKVSRFSGIPVEGINGFLIFNWLGYLSLSLQFLLLQIFLLARKKNARRD